MTAHYDKPPAVDDARAARLEFGRSRARKAVETRTRPRTDASSGSDERGAEEENEPGGAGEDRDAQEQNQELRVSDQSETALKRLDRHRARNMALAVKNVSESMLPSMLWMSGFLRARLLEMDDTHDWMGQCNPRAPAHVWPGTFRRCAARCGTCVPRAVMLTLAGPREHWIPDDAEADWGRLWARPVQAPKLQPPARPLIILGAPTTVLPDVAPP